MSDKTPIQEFIPDPSPSTEDYEVRLMVRAGTGRENEMRQFNLMPADREAMRWALHEIDALRRRIKELEPRDTISVGRDLWARLRKERDELAAALDLLMNPRAEKLYAYYREASWRQHDEMSGTHAMARAYLSIGEIVRLLDAKKLVTAVLEAQRTRQKEAK